ncbi:MAG: glutamate racemase [Bacteroidales bacterium]|nr:glutamate racemase [Bacteroidales bacterium]
MNQQLSSKSGPIGVFDSGYGGLTILQQFRKILPEYDYLYLGDNARAPYGSRSFEVVYEFTLQAVNRLFEEGCQLVILACNTASAKALRNIQQKNLPNIDPTRRVLGIIRPTIEIIDGITKTKHIGVLGTTGTIQSETYNIEINKLFPHIITTGEACPMWVPLVENREFDHPGADYFVKKHIDEILHRDSQIDTLVLGCTHYPLLVDKIQRFIPEGVQILSQGKYVAESLHHYLQVHPEMSDKCTKGGTCKFYTTESVEKFSDMASIFLSENIDVEHLSLE